MRLASGLAVGALLLSHLVVHPGEAAADSTSEPASLQLPSEITENWWSETRCEIARSEYHISRPSQKGAAGAYQAPNRAHGFRTFFTGQGIRVLPRAATRDEVPAWEWTLSLARWGREGGLLLETTTARQRAEANRIEYDRGELTEWYVNDPRGLEQGFTITRRPSSGAGSE